MPVIVATGKDETVTVNVFTLVHPFALVTVTVYKVETVGFRMTEGEEDPVFHKYVAPPDAVSVVGLPGQIVVFPEIDAVIPFETVTTVLAVSAQLPLPTKTEYVVLVVGETFIAAVVAPVVQE